MSIQHGRTRRHVLGGTYNDDVTALPEVTAAALTLPRDERADLAYKLIVSLDEPFDEPGAVKSEWTAEISRRLRNIESGATTGITLDEVRQQFKT